MTASESVVAGQRHSAIAFAPCNAELLPFRQHVLCKRLTLSRDNPSHSVRTISWTHSQKDSSFRHTSHHPHIPAPHKPFILARHVPFHLLARIYSDTSAPVPRTQLLRHRETPLCAEHIVSSVFKPSSFEDTLVVRVTVLTPAVENPCMAPPVSFVPH